AVLEHWSSLLRFRRIFRSGSLEPARLNHRRTGRTVLVIVVNVAEYRSKITSYQVGLSRDTHSVRTLRKNYAPGWFLKPNQSVWKADFGARPGFQHYVNKYAEVVTLNPWDDVVEFFRRAPTNLSIGGLPPGPLHYPMRYPLLNTAAMAAAAEALAGWF